MSRLTPTTTFYLKIAQQTLEFEPILVSCWVSVVGDGPAIIQIESTYRVCCLVADLGPYSGTSYDIHDKS